MGHSDLGFRQPSTHVLKTWPPYFEDVASGRKTFEIRNADRPYMEGDLLDLREWDPKAEEFTGRQVTRRVSYLCHLSEFVGWDMVGMAIEETD